ncbi:hypothetical protein SAMN05216330_112139 [Bradyrhizobium sp. Ghvi]|uniref:hypothetical protein n=1 Tax=Bradyrhizobium sp. Ghvi TaxID=1855319 RepID=UPI0008E9AB29|nr:hypothetical protein [Bradyrhizobium sp. Ghvi]SFP94754.1 hypothetical protein SAMN05216330_112139 [Bradyrhizobium sp. Ghvi]
MARRTRSTPLETRTNRLKLEIRKRAYGVRIAPRLHLLYRRCKGPGTWSYRKGDLVRRFAIADDHEDGNNNTIMDYWQALEQAKKLARVNEGSTRKHPIKVGEVVQPYGKALEVNGQRKYNATQLDRHLTEQLKAKTVALCTEDDFRDWRAGLIESGLKPSSADRIARSLKSALNLVAAKDKSIGNAAMWREGLKGPNKEKHKPRNILVPDRSIPDLVAGCYQDDAEFGLIIETLAEIGCRESQLFKLRVHHLLDDDPAKPQLEMPDSAKGSNRKRIREVGTRKLSITPRLAAKLRLQANGRALDEPLFDKMWNLATRLSPVVKRLGLDPKIVPYSFRHSSICRMLLKGVPVRVVATHHDSSIREIERSYSAYILNHSDALTRATLLDLDAKPPASNVTPIRGAAA